MKKYTIHLDPDAVDEIVLTELRSLRDDCLRNRHPGQHPADIQCDNNVIAACDFLIGHCGGDVDKNLGESSV